MTTSATGPRRCLPRSMRRPARSSPRRIVAIDRSSSVSSSTASTRTCRPTSRSTSILDNYGTHKTPLIRAWLAKRPRFHVHFTPTYGSWLNLVERWFGELTTKQIRRGAHRSVSELERAIWEFIDVRNDEPKPFVWTKSADEILASIARFAQRTAAAMRADLLRESLLQDTSGCVSGARAGRLSHWPL